MRQAISGDVEFIKRIEKLKFRGWVHSHFERTINIHCKDHGELYTIAYDGMDNGPNTLVIDITSFKDLNIAVNENVYVKNKVLNIENKLEIATEGSKKWNCSLPQYPLNDEVLKSNLVCMKQYIDSHGKCGGMKRNESTKNIFEEETSKMLAERSESLISEISNNNVANALKSASGLIGLGPGLTPSGDDFLVGLITAFQVKKSDSYQEFTERFVQLAQPLTNEISYAAMKQASIGRVRESLVHLVNSLITGNKEELILSLNNVLNIGSSSGTDIALGLVSGMEMNIKVGGK
ncbi:DUF2877 domain-containing protein [Cytobacillus depressus]|uniref:DUF2877 domain-containing protein n=1 Tax=Cytobacillus depressus TaxID=1602942 RepID=A0A6L3V7U2_9BACI|nr:DUF2877 domain-containing protein [Cytobacillus depressus]KAB2332255.1 DUF2877 domain-containing protein [Cytobacillus depressus]